MKYTLKKKIEQVALSLWPEIQLTFREIIINYPPQQFGDYSCNVALQLAKQLKKNPMEIAGSLREALQKR